MSTPDPHIVCLGCGRTAIGPQGDPTDIAPSTHCSECPPWRCGDCGQMCSHDALCSCWTSFDGMVLADIKGLLTKGDMGVEVTK